VAGRLHEAEEYQHHLEASLSEAQVRVYSSSLLSLRVPEGPCALSRVMHKSMSLLDTSPPRNHCRCA